MSTGGVISNDIVKDALQRAKELAASQTTGIKRAASESDDYPTKRVNQGDESGNMMGMGMMSGGIGDTNGGQFGGMGNPMENVVESIQIPDNTVGLVIGRGGEQISTIQKTSGARVQMAPDSAGAGTRLCTVQGSKVCVEKAKQMIYEVINRSNQREGGGGGGGVGGGMGGGGMPGGGFPMGGSITTEVMVPANRCGLIIGKAGETIRMLQEQSGAKMQMIQDSKDVTGQPKMLRISGEPQKVEHAKQLVADIVNAQARDDGPGGGGGGMGQPQFQGGDGASARGEVVVPRSSVGMIIGKGGETIKRLAYETGTKIQFKPDDDPNTPDRCAVISGTRDQIYRATERITELVQRSAQAGGGVDTFYMHVPANKTGLVIGRGGETIKQINAESGAHCELSRDPPPNENEKVFVIKGTPYQIHHAQHIIRIKVGDVAPGTPIPPFSGPGGPGPGPQMQPPQQMYGGPGQGMGGGFDQYGGQPMGGQGQQWNQSYGAPQPQPVPQAQYGGWGAQAAAPQQQYGGISASSAYQQPQQTMAQPQYAAAQMQPAQQQQVAAAPQAMPQQAAAAAPSASAAPAINPATGQPDYSAQWAQYYRSMGMHDQAAAIEAQMRGGQPAAGGVPGQAQQMQAMPGYGQAH